jgi:hypothetical protein
MNAFDMEEERSYFDFSTMRKGICKRLKVFRLKAIRLF